MRLGHRFSLNISFFIATNLTEIMSSTVQRLAPAVSGVFQYAFGFGIGAVMGTATYFYQTRETTLIGDGSEGITTRLRWANGPPQVSDNEAPSPLPIDVFINHGF